MNALRSRCQQGHFGFVGLFSAGFAVSSVLFFSAFYALSTDAQKAPFLVPFASAILVALLLHELLSLWKKRSYSLGVSRQSPQTFRYQRFGPLAWGLDVGLPFTTYRYSVLTWIGLALLVRQPSSWLAIPAYALGFAVPLLLLVLSHKSSESNEIPDRSTMISQGNKPRVVAVLITICVLLATFTVS